jgi:hypothetical protein
MRQPFHRVTADAAITLGDVRPLDVFSQPEKNAGSTLVGAIGQYDFVAFVKCVSSY